ncbi:phytanoyl-CoA dioxygenase family protein [Nocardia farcinica]|uniref:phytanoyl-CoA dioxygenase family protein n=1 Tax=Nocardia farcinica TaxID=37329 RepID=UPI00245599A1|nr:phytanoyl-CoA dioxygenase family protein [Nocardia farcinica]
MLTTEDRALFATDGVLIKRDLIACDRIESARSLIDDWLVTGMDLNHLAGYTQRTFAPELGSHPILLDLYYAREVAGAVRELVGEPCPVKTAQIQIRLPQNQLHKPQPTKAMHVDGVACPHLDPNELRTFSLLVGVVLSDIGSPSGGALHYQPGGHLRMSEWFRDEWALGLTHQTPPDVDSEKGIPFLGKPGDVLLMHHLVPHAVGANITSTPRTMVYFRVSHVDHQSRRLAALKDPWLDFPALVASRQGR